MSSIDEDRVRTLAGALYDEVVAPLAEARKGAGKQSYFPLRGEPGATHWHSACLTQAMDRPTT